MVLLHSGEQALLVLKSRSFSRQDRWRQLFWISDQDTLRTSVFQGDQSRQLNGLRGFIDDDSLEFDIEALEYLVAAAAQGGAQDMSTI
jgi:hypothetical protein